MKAREEGSIRWNELLDKFKNVQDRARKVQRMASMENDGIVIPQGPDRKAQTLEPPKLQGMQGRPLSAASVGRPPVGSPAQAPRAKGGLSNLGRFAGSVGARKNKR